MLGGLVIPLRWLVLALSLGAPDDPGRALAEGRFADAAQAIEASTTEESELLWLAAEIRTGLGEVALAEVDFAASERIAGRRSPADAAAAFWRRREVLLSQEDRVEHARIYLKRHAKRGGVARRIVAEATIGRSEWFDSCERGLVTGLCMRFQMLVARAHPPRDPRRWKIVPRERRSIDAACVTWFGGMVVYERDPRRAAAASARFRRVLALAREAEGAALAEPEARAAILEARLWLLDRSLESYLMTYIGDDLRLYPDRWLPNSKDPADLSELRRQRRAIARAERTLARATATLATEGAALRERYAALAASEGPGWIASASAHRSALVSHHHAVELGGLRPAGGFPSHEEGQRWCDARSAQVTSLREATLEAYARCVASATQRGGLDEFAALCEGVLAVFSPHEYPGRVEFIGAPELQPSVPESVGVVLEPATE